MLYEYGQEALDRIAKPIGGKVRPASPALARSALAAALLPVADPPF